MPSELITILATSLRDGLLPILGVDATWEMPAPAVPLTVRGIFDQSEEARIELSGGRCAGRFWVPQVDLPVGAAKGDDITIDGVVYDLRTSPADRQFFDGAVGVWLYLRVK